MLRSYSDRIVCPVGTPLRLSSYTWPLNSHAAFSPCVSRSPSCRAAPEGSMSGRRTTTRTRLPRVTASPRRVHPHKSSAFRPSVPLTESTTPRRPPLPPRSSLCGSRREPGKLPQSSACTISWLNFSCSKEIWRAGGTAPHCAPWPSVRNCPTVCSWPSSRPTVAGIAGAGVDRSGRGRGEGLLGVL